jgi:hypothetical protein
MPTLARGKKIVMRSQETILLLGDRRQNQTAKALRNAGYSLMTAFTPDHAVAMCVNNNFLAAVLDQEHFIVTEDWSVARSLKMIKPSLCVVLVVRGKIAGHDAPAGVDAIVPERDTQALLEALKRVL